MGLYCDKIQYYWGAHALYWRTDGWTRWTIWGREAVVLVVVELMMENGRRHHQQPHLMPSSALAFYPASSPRKSPGRKERNLQARIFVSNTTRFRQKGEGVMAWRGRGQYRSCPGHASQKQSGSVVDRESGPVIVRRMDFLSASTRVRHLMEWVCGRQAAAGKHRNHSLNPLIRRLGLYYLHVLPPGLHFCILRCSSFGWVVVKSDCEWCGWPRGGHKKGRHLLHKTVSGRGKYKYVFYIHTKLAMSAQERRRPPFHPPTQPYCERKGT